MPWCDTCSKFWNPTSMAADGTCPTCGKLIEVDAVRDGKHLNVKELAGADDKVPWHFKLMVGALAIYLGWRLVQLIVLIFR